jgi:hypothetical protein
LLLLYVAIFGLEIGDLDLKGAQDMRFGIDIRAELRLPTSRRI